jgi:hypothetical protein
MGCSDIAFGESSRNMNNFLCMERSEGIVYLIAQKEFLAIETIDGRASMP